MFDDFLEMVESRLPEFCSRKKAEEVMDGLLKARTLANLDSKGIGPCGILIGKKIMYKKNDLMIWLSAYLNNSSVKIINSNRCKQNRDEQHMFEES